MKTGLRLRIESLAKQVYIHGVIPVDFIFVEVANLQMELGYATFLYPEPVLYAVNRA